ncbi:unnamed protein product [Rhizoctonia solani]|uniref:Transmembrane protein n=1 Tax=Rhizoctonia solani TaxID=456999 RepID=A0A8H2WSS8_9AGAM|nr:unnamed protein product [Rhizoctonia solani]
MGEFPEPAIRGSTVEESSSALFTSVTPSQLIQSTDSSPSSSSSWRVEIKTSIVPSSTPATSKAATSFSFAPSTSRPSTTAESSTPVQSTTSTIVTTSIQPTSTIPPTSTPIPQSTSSQIISLLSAPSSTTITVYPSSTLISATTETSIESETTSSSGIVTRPIITPTSSPPAPLATTAPTAYSHLPFGAIMGIVASVLVVIAVAGICIIVGPRRALRKMGIGAKRDDEKMDYDDWERTHRESASWSGRRASIGASSDWWKPPAPLPTRPSTISVGGPGMAGVGAGRGMDADIDSPVSPVPRRMSQRRVEERGAVRSGWFAASMVRGASLLSLGSLVRPPAEPSYGSSGGSERMSRMGTGGSAGKRFQELYRRERASRTSTLVKSNQPTEYLATVSELGEHEPSRAGQRRASGDMGVYRSRSMAPKVRQPSRLAMSYVPEIVVQDATLPNLASVSSVTHESGGRGYDADAEAERYPRVI